MATTPETVLADAAAPEAQPVSPETTAATDFYNEGADPAKPEGGDPAVEGEETPPEMDPIEPPASWDKEAKERFSSYSREDQEYIAKRASEDHKALRTAQNEAAGIRQRAEGEVRQAVEQHTRQYAEQLQRYAQMFQPQEPDTRLLQSNDPEHHRLYLQQQAQFQQGIQQRDQFAREAQQAQAQADQLAQQQQHEAGQAEYAKLVEAIPEWSDPSTRSTLVAQLEPIGAELGYTPELMAQAGATDILALKMAHSWKQDADKYRDLMKKKMEPVRAAKQIPPSARGGAPVATGQPVSVAAQLYPNDVRH